MGGGDEGFHVIAQCFDIKWYSVIYSEMEAMLPFVLSYLVQESGDECSLINNHPDQDRCQRSDSEQVSE